MTVEEMIVRRRELGLSYDMLSALSGVPVGTINKILNGHTKAPRFDTLQALERVLARPAGVSMLDSPDGAVGMLRETQPVYGSGAKQDGHHTIFERNALPEDVRTELIDGVFYDMASPSMNHQRILTELLMQFYMGIAAHGSSCEVIPSPADVYLDADLYTVVQPDLFVRCKDGACAIRNGKVYGAPDLVIEILSPATKNKDQFLKLNKYQASGVKEYWIVDPDKRTVTVFYLAAMRGDEGASGDEITIYGFDAEIPVRISGGSMSIDIKRIGEKMDTSWKDDV